MKRISDFPFIIGKLGIGNLKEKIECIIFRIIFETIFGQNNFDEEIDEKVLTEKINKVIQPELGISSIILLVSPFLSKLLKLEVYDINNIEYIMKHLVPHIENCTNDGLLKCLTENVNIIEDENQVKFLQYYFLIVRKRETIYAIKF